ncbi:MAG: hypothetical protein QOI58_1187 [Thermoanaerobaculia bacterium]|nr:hypothetical protein [Thermoanaerobaculia bacterium]
MPVLRGEVSSMGNWQKLIPRTKYVVPNFDKLWAQYVCVLIHNCLGHSVELGMNIVRQRIEIDLMKQIFQRYSSLG